VIPLFIVIFLGYLLPDSTIEKPMITIGVDLGGTTTKIGLVCKDQVIAHTKIKSDADLNMRDKLPVIASEIDSLIRQAGVEKPQAIGLAFPSIVDSVKMRILNRYVKFSDAMDVDFQAWADKSWSIPLILENDAKAALVGEWQYGAARGENNIVLVTLGTGVGSAVIMDGQLLSGAHYMAGNLGGHMVINFQGDDCNCGSVGCLETEASSWALPRFIRKVEGFQRSNLAVAPDFRTVFQLAAEGDEFAKRLRERCLGAWSAGILNLVHAFDPEMIVLGGGIMQSGSVIIPYIQKRIDQYSWGGKGTVRVVPAVHAEEAGLLGAAYLAGRFLKRQS
jgi:glucokinase